MVEMFSELVDFSSGKYRQFSKPTQREKSQLFAKNGAQR
jgi:hypothetical protein